MRQINKTIPPLFAALLFAPAPHAESIEQQLQSLTQQVEQLSRSQPNIKVGGAVRFQYSYEDYNQANKDRLGDIDFDTFRLNLDGEIDGVILSAEYRWYQYMNVIHHAWVGYNFNENHNAKVGITKVPFGIGPFASHNFFFSSNYYLGLEDDYDSGVNYQFKKDNSNLELAFYKNDENGGSGSNARYSYDMIGAGVIDGQVAIKGQEKNTFNGRYRHQLAFDALQVELGASVKYGGVELEGFEDGTNTAYALHTDINYQALNVNLQATHYEYDIPNFDAGAVAVGAYAYNDEIAAQADTYIANIAYSLPTNIGPISNITFYNDYSLVTNKSADLKDTFMNVTGMAVSAGGVYAYFDFLVARNQPFMGGSMVADGKTNKRLNINIGYYF